MGYLAACGFDTGDTAGAITAGTGGGVVSFSNSIARDGGYSLRCTPVGAGTAEIQYATMDLTTGAAAIYSAATVYHRFYMYIAALPASANEEFFQSWNTGATGKINLRITSAGNILAYDSVTALVGTGTATLVTGVWYMIEVKCATGSPAAFEVMVDGVVDISATGNLNASNNGRVRFGKGNNRNSQGYDIYFDTWAVSDSGYPGRGKGKWVSPTSTPTSQWTSGTGTSNHLEVDEIPVNLADYVMNTTSASRRVLFAFPTTTSLSISGQINAVMPLLLGCRENTSVTSSFDGEIWPSAGFKSIFGSALNITTTDRVIGGFYALNPETSAQWTTAELDASKVGALEANASAQCRIAGAGYYVDYTPPADVIDAYRGFFALTRIQ